MTWANAVHCTLINDDLSTGTITLNPPTGPMNRPPLTGGTLTITNAFEIDADKEFEIISYEFAVVNNNITTLNNCTRALQGTNTPAGGWSADSIVFQGITKNELNRIDDLKDISALEILGGTATEPRIFTPKNLVDMMNIHRHNDQLNQVANIFDTSYIEHKGYPDADNTHANILSVAGLFSTFNFNGSHKIGVSKRNQYNSITGDPVPVPDLTISSLYTGTGNIRLALQATGHKRGTYMHFGTPYARNFLIHIHRVGGGQDGLFQTFTAEDIGNNVTGYRGLPVLLLEDTGLPSDQYYGYNVSFENSAATSNSFPGVFAYFQDAFLVAESY